MTYATRDDVQRRLGRPVTDPNEREQIDAWLEDAEGLIRSQLPGLDDLVDTGRVSQGTVVSVTARAVVRVALNPEGWRQVSIDDFHRTRDQAVSDGQLHITDAEWAELMPWVHRTGEPTAYMLTLGTPL